jgi:ketosteroid isomerase-like protein
MADVNELKATFEQVLAAINRQDAAAWVSFVHDDFVAFPPFSPFAVESKEAFRQFAQLLFAGSESVTVTPINPQFRVIGDPGVIWTHLALTFKPQDGPVQTTFVREVVTYAKVDGRWRAVSTHISRIPSGN